MFSWFSTIFATNSDKAKLITVMISATIAVIVVLINQNMTRKREYNSFKANKLEDIYKSCVELIHNLNDVANIKINIQKEDDIESNKILIQKSVKKAKEQLANIIMIKDLYFPEMSMPNFNNEEVAQAFGELSYLSENINRTTNIHILHSFTLHDIAGYYKEKSMEAAQQLNKSSFSKLFNNKKPA